MNKLVSIISPCYNGESYISRFLDSVYNQSYPYIEFIIVNDGSTDNTEDIILKYSEKFISKGFKFHYLKQENAGQSAAINKALEIFTGEYLTWPDSDDFLPKDSIFNKVKYLEENPQYGIVICKTQVVEDETFKPIRIQERIKPQHQDNLFYDLINGKNVYYSPGGYMVRSKMFRDSMPNPLKIDSPKEIGQNFQLLLPISFKYPCGYIDDIGYHYTLRLGSHSRCKLSFEKKINALNIGEKVLYNINNNIETTQQEHTYISNLIRKRTLTSTIQLMYQFKRNENIEQIYAELKKISTIDNDLKFKIISIKYPYIKHLYNIYIKLKQYIKQ